MNLHAQDFPTRFLAEKVFLTREIFENNPVLRYIKMFVPDHLCKKREKDLQMGKRSDSLCQSKPAWKRHAVWKIAILLLIAAGVIANYLKAEFPEICRPKYRPDELTRKWIPYPGIDEFLRENRKLWNIWFGQKIPLYQHIMLNGKTILSDPASPIILYGNSYLHTPEALPGIYLASLLTEKLKMGFSIMFRIATQPLTSMSLELLQEPEKYLKGKKVCLFYYGVSHFRQTQIWNIRELDQIKRQNSILLQQPEKNKK